MNDVRKIRRYGQSCDYLKWVNENPHLPSRVGEVRLGVQDVDVLLHVFMTAIDKIGCRDLQIFTIQEVKTRNGEPDNSQRDTWWKQDLFLHNQTIQDPEGSLLWHRGVFIVSLEGTFPKEGEIIRWGKYLQNGSIFYRNINPEQLTLLIRGDLHPDTFQKETHRRHYATKVIAAQTFAELGFPIFEKIIKRS